MDYLQDRVLHLEREVTSMQDQFYGDRSATMKDPFGHIWTLATHKEDLAPAEIRRRFEALFAGAPAT